MKTQKNEFRSIPLYCSSKGKSARNIYTRCLYSLHILYFIIIIIYMEFFIFTMIYSSFTNNSLGWCFFVCYLFVFVLQIFLKLLWSITKSFLSCKPLISHTPTHVNSISTFITSPPLYWINLSHMDAKKTEKSFIPSSYVFHSHAHDKFIVRHIS